MRICKTQIYTLNKISIEKPSLFSEIVTPTQKKISVCEVVYNRIIP